MTSYVLGIVGVIFVCAIITAILPEGKTAALIKGIARLACVLAILSPIFVFFQSSNGTITEKLAIFFPKTVIQTDEEYIKYYSETRVALAETAIEKQLKTQYSVAVQVSIFWEQAKENGREDSAKLKITQIRIYTDGKQTQECVENMRAFIAENYCSEVLIE